MFAVINLSTILSISVHIFIKNKIDELEDATTKISNMKKDILDFKTQLPDKDKKVFEIISRRLLDTEVAEKFMK